MYLSRKIDTELVLWKNSPERKPLLLRGARQVGKSSTVRALGKKFKYFIEINFDEQPIYKAIFNDGFDPKVICEKIEVLSNTSIIENETLIFFDEVQSCVPAISALRYFYEKMPGLHLIATGSLLEFALAETPSFGVGRVRSMFVYPFSFEEFLLANNQKKLYETLKKHSNKNEFPVEFHQKLISFLKKFMVIGGMPEAVKKYVQNGNLREVQHILDDLIISIEADFVKYKQTIESSRVREVFGAVVKQVGNKFTYTYPNASLNNKQIKDILELLQMAGLVHFVTHSASNGIPIGAETNPKVRKILIFDTGIFQRLLNLNIAEIILEDHFSFINKGNLAELYVGLELLKNGSCYEKKELNYWHRDAKNSQAEVDYVIQVDQNIIPIEVKAGTKGAMQSLYKFLEEKDKQLGVRTSLESFSQMKNIKIIPLYAIGNLEYYCKEED